MTSRRPRVRDRVPQRRLRARAAHRVALPLVLALFTLTVAVGCDERAPSSHVRFETVPASHDDEVAVRIGASSPVELRAEVMEATASREIVPTFLARGAWESIAVLGEGDTIERVVERGRTFVRHGGALRLDVRAGAGDRGAFMGGVVETGAERAMIQVKLEDRETLGARFRIRIHRVTSRARPEDVTPAYLASALPRGTYRAWVDVPPEGARFVVEVETTTQDQQVVARAWASPIGFERPWLTGRDLVE